MRVLKGLQYGWNTDNKRSIQQKIKLRRRAQAFNQCCQVRPLSWEQRWAVSTMLTEEHCYMYCIKRNLKFKDHMWFFKVVYQSEFWQEIAHWSRVTEESSIKELFLKLSSRYREINKVQIQAGNTYYQVLKGHRDKVDQNPEWKGVWRGPSDIQERKVP